MELGNFKSATVKSCQNLMDFMKDAIDALSKEDKIIFYTKMYELDVKQLN